MKSNHKKWLIALLIIVLLGVALLIYFWMKSGQQHSASFQYPPVKVALTTVSLKTAPRKLTAVGELEAVRQIQVGSEAAGRIQQIYFQSGQYVNAGQLLIQLNDDIEQAEIVQLKAKLKLNEAVYQRGQALLKINAVAKEEVENALANRDVMLGQIQQLNAKIQQKKIRAPFSGVIGIRRVHQGQFLNIGEPIVSLVDTQYLLVNFNLDERSTPNIKVGQQLQVGLDAFPDQQFTAQVTAIDPLISSSRTVSVQAKLPNLQQQFKAGMYANVVLQQHEEQVLMMPETAVTYTAYGETVFKAVDHQGQLQASKVAVKIGERSDGWVEVKSGLKQGDRVVSSGQLKLSDAMPIEAMSQHTLELDKTKVISAMATETPVKKQEATE